MSSTSASDSKQTLNNAGAPNLNPGILSTDRMASTSASDSKQTLNNAGAPNLNPGILSTDRMASTSASDSKKTLNNAGAPNLNPGILSTDRMASTSAGKRITLKSSDGEELVVEEKVAMYSKLIRHMIKHECAESIIPLPINSKILGKVMEYCKKHVYADEERRASKIVVLDAKILFDRIVKDVELTRSDTAFVQVDNATLIELLEAARYLKLPNLVLLICEKTARMIYGKTLEEVGNMFNLKTDITPEAKNFWKSKLAFLFEKEKK